MLLKNAILKRIALADNSFDECENFYHMLRRHTAISIARMVSYG